MQYELTNAPRKTSSFFFLLEAEVMAYECQGSDHAMLPQSGSPKASFPPNW